MSSSGFQGISSGTLRHIKYIKYIRDFKGFHEMLRVFKRFQGISWDFKGCHSEKYSVTSHKTIIADISGISRDCKEIQGISRDSIEPKRL